MQLCLELQSEGRAHIARLCEEFPEINCWVWLLRFAAKRAYRCIHGVATFSEDHRHCQSQHSSQTELRTESVVPSQSIGEVDVVEKSMNVMTERRGGGGDKGPSEDSDVSESVAITGVTQGEVVRLMCQRASSLDWTSTMLQQARLRWIPVILTMLTLPLEPRK